MCTKDATMSAKDASKAAASAGEPRPCAEWLRQSRRQVGESEAPAKFTEFVRLPGGYPTESPEFAFSRKASDTAPPKVS